MLAKTAVSDKDLLRMVQQRLARMGSGPEAQLFASVHHGTVTLSGTLLYENQRAPLVRAINNIAGVQSVVDQLRIGPRKSY